MAENYAVYNHASAFAVDALFLAGRSDEAERYLERLLPFRKDALRTRAGAIIPPMPAAAESAGSRVPRIGWFLSFSISCSRLRAASPHIAIFPPGS